MPDLLNALRRLYGEPGPEGISSPGEEAEARALAEVKAGLDALPKRRPDAATLDAVVAMATESLPALGDDPAEAAALAEVEAGLDALPRRRPDAETLEAVFAAAASATLIPAPATDRPARRSAPRRRAAALGTAFVLLLAVASVLWIVPGDVAAPPIAANAPQAETGEPEAEGTEAAEEAEPGATVSEPLADASPRSEATASVSAGRSASEQVASSSGAPPPAAARAAAPTPADLAAVAAAQSGDAAEAAADFQLVGEPMPFADGDDELRLLYLRMLEMRAAQAGLGWDEPPTALGTVPDSVPAAGGWMQVRVER